KRCLLKAWLRRQVWKYGLPMQMAAKPGRLHHSARPTGHRHLCPTANGSFLHPITNIKEGSLLICIPSTKTGPDCKKSAATKDLMPFPCSLPTGKKLFFAVTATMAAQ